LLATLGSLPKRAHAPIVARIAAATIGGYGFSYSVAAALSLVLPMARSEVVILTAFLAIILHLVMAVWAFACHSITRFWLVLIGISVPLYGVSFWWGV